MAPFENYNHVRCERYVEGEQLFDQEERTVSQMRTITCATTLFYALFMISKYNYVTW